MKRTLILFAIATLGSVSSGCGTLLSRGEGSFCGAYPFEAVAADVVMIAGQFDQDQEAWILRGLVSLPFDLVVDIALAPIDLVAWPFGHRKGKPRSPEPEASEDLTEEGHLLKEKVGGKQPLRSSAR